MEQRYTRRELLRRLVGGGVAGVVVLGIKPKGAVAEHCYWRKVYGPSCNGGQKLEQWSYTCCAGTTCWVEWYEWRVVGSC